MEGVDDRHKFFIKMSFYNFVISFCFMTISFSGASILFSLNSSVSYHTFSSLQCTALCKKLQTFKPFTRNCYHNFHLCDALFVCSIIV